MKIIFTAIGALIIGTVVAIEIGLSSIGSGVLCLGIYALVLPFHLGD